jgi:predicted esterase
MIFNKRFFSASPVSVYLLCLCVAGTLFAADKSEPNFAPGGEFRIDVNSKLVGIDHFMVCVPSDYNDKQDWPVIFFYHGMGGQPTTWPFKQITGGKGFIIIGMGYVPGSEEPMTEGQYMNYIKRERRSVLEVKRYLSEHLRIDEKRFFVTGSSMGGWHTAALLESSPKVWAGAVILAAGRTRAVNMLATETSRKALRGKPIYIGAGEEDTNLSAARKAAAYYEKVGAKVTFEEYKGAGHAFDPANPKQLYSWLIANSSVREAQSDSSRRSAPQPNETDSGEK